MPIPCHLVSELVSLADINAPVNCTDGEVRLYGENLPNEGTLHVCQDRAWSTMCANHWSITDTNVVCKELGFSKYSELIMIPLYIFF